MFNLSREEQEHIKQFSEMTDCQQDISWALAVQKNCPLINPWKMLAPKLYNILMDKAKDVDDGKIVFTEENGLLKYYAIKDDKKWLIMELVPLKFPLFGYKILDYKIGDVEYMPSEAKDGN